MQGNILIGGLSAFEVGIMADAIDDMIAVWGKQCQLIFPQTGQVFCPNCVWDSMTRRSSNVYKSGGPVPFGQGGFCPVCGGKGVMPPPAKTKTITMIVRWNPGEFLILPGEIEVPYSVCETEGHIADWPSVQQARVMMIETPISGLMRQRFELSGEPIDANSISQGQTFSCHWKRSG